VPGQPNRRATHVAEIPYVFNIPGPLWTEVDRRLADTISSYWVNFACTGDPNGPGLPQWSAFEPRDHDRRMLLGPVVEAGPSLDAAHVAVFDALLQRLVPQAARD
jgi:carboxylesterase type B